MNMISSRISDAFRLRVNPNGALAQNVQPNLHPTWDEMQSVTLFSSGRKTDSIVLESSSLNKYFIVRTSWLFGPGRSTWVDQVADRQESPSQIVSGQELLDCFRAKLGAEERYLAEQRALGREWNDLAVELGQGAEGLRKQLQRAVDRVAQELGMEV